MDLLTNGQGQCYVLSQLTSPSGTIRYSSCGFNLYSKLLLRQFFCDLIQGIQWLCHCWKHLQKSYFEFIKCSLQLFTNHDDVITSTLQCQHKSCHFWWYQRVHQLFQFSLLVLTLNDMTLFLLVSQQTKHKTFQQSTACSLVITFWHDPNETPTLSTKPYIFSWTSSLIHDIFIHSTRWRMS